MADILYLDDDEELAEAVKLVLVNDGHKVSTVNSGPTGWTHIKSQPFDVVILDWEMPDLNGIDILKLMRTSGDSTPVIMMTSRSSTEDKVLGLDCGANDYLTKPFVPQELCARVRAALRSKASPAPAPKALGSNNVAVLNRAKLAGTAVAAHLEFVELIGEGGFALVFKARHPQLEKFVAVKMLLPSELSADMVSRFVREARIVSNLDHPNIVAVHDFGITENKQPYMVMELVEGPSLYKVIQDKDFLSLKEGLTILLPVASALCYAHDQGILHRDIKPENIVLKEGPDEGVVPKVLDFGLAKVIELDLNSSKEARLTQGQQMLGSPPYMSPEQVRGKPLDERSDIYSFGCLVFEVFTGFTPFVGDTPMEITLKHLEEAPLSFKEAQPTVKYPAELEQLVARALQKDPVKRYQTMHELCDELGKLLAKSSDNSIWGKLRKIKIFG
jgi:CheY-like chemotaxis protein/tRNA A-37 threonylcarbamoyl transferase component Bud32